MSVSGPKSLNSLHWRLITSVVLIPLVMGAVLWLPTAAFALVLTLVLARGAWEWCALAGITAPWMRAAYIVLLLGAMALLWPLPQAQFALIVASTLWWGWQSVRLIRLQQVSPRARRAPEVLAAGLLVLLAAWAALVYLHQAATLGPGLVLFLLLLIWTADSTAYFVGRRWGRVKLAPVLSPGKTWAGVYGALVGAALCALLFAGWRDLGSGQTLMLVLVCALTALVSVVGDLYESLLKRRCGVKDSGRLLPGHGGLLDRIDSLIAAAPLFLLGLTLMGVES